MMNLFQSLCCLHLNCQRRADRPKPHLPAGFFESFLTLANIMNILAGISMTVNSEESVRRTKVQMQAWNVVFIVVGSKGSCVRTEA